MQYNEAKDAMYSLFNAALIANASAIVGYVPDVEWEGDTSDAPPDKTKFWCRPSAQLVVDGQSSLGNAGGKRRYESRGLLYIQIFCPRNVAETKDNGILLAQMIRDTFRPLGSQSALWFLNQTIKELPATSEAYPINVVVEFRFDTLQ